MKNFEPEIYNDKYINGERILYRVDLLVSLTAAVAFYIFMFVITVAIILGFGI